MEKVEVSYFQRKAAQWVSQITLLGCTLILIGILYVAKQSEDFANTWVSRDVTLLGN